MDRVFSQRDYLRIERSIAWFRAHATERSRVGGMAAAAGMSERDYRRLFSRWAGIAPERFLPYLRPAYAQRIMRQSASLFDPGPGNGPAGPDRRYAPAVTLEGMSPDQFERVGDGLVIEYGEVETPFGRAAIGFTDRGVCHFSFPAPTQRVGEVLRAAWPGTALLRRDEAAASLASGIFEGAVGTRPKPLSIWLFGSTFQVQVWRALLRLPPGFLWSYAELARRAGHPGAARAVGSAMAANPVAYLVPCHRVLPWNGEVGRYQGGSDRKALMVGWEAAARAGSVEARG